MTKKELGSSTKKAQNEVAAAIANTLKTTDSRAESHPSKVTHNLTKQDSSRYLGGQQVIAQV